MSTIAFITSNLLRFLSNCPIKEKKNRWTEWRIGFPMDLGSLETIRSYLETISRLRNHQSSGVKVHSTGNLHLPRVGAKPRGRREGEPARKSLRRRVRERGTQDTGTFRWRKNTHRDEFRPAGPRAPLQKPQKKEGSRWWPGAGFGILALAGLHRARARRPKAAASLNTTTQRATSSTPFLRSRVRKSRWISSSDGFTGRTRTIRFPPLYGGCESDSARLHVNRELDIRADVGQVPGNCSGKRHLLIGSCIRCESRWFDRNSIQRSGKLFRFATVVLSRIFMLMRVL